MNDKKTGKKLNTASYINPAIFLMVAFAVLGMFFGFLGEEDSALTETRIETFKFFTIDSNILMGLIALAAFFKIKRTGEISKALAVWILVGTVGVTVTMLVTVGFLTAVIDDPISLFTGSNFWLHLVVPVVSILNFCIFEKTDALRAKDTLYALLPVVIYGSVYVANIIIHTKGGEPGTKYDWYGFLTLGDRMLIFGLPLMLLFTWVIAFALYKLNRRSADR